MSDVVQQIKDKLNIIDVVSPYVELHKAGKNFKGKSPFSAEKTPSFYVSPDRGMYYCFSTSQGGDIFSFIQAMEGIDFKGALKQLAEKAGVELVPEDPQKKSERDRWYAVLKEATDFFAAQLEATKNAKAYLEKRGVLAETIQKWQIGYAPGPPSAGWREVKEHLEAKGYTKEELLKTGLIKTTDGGKEPYDVFRDRIMFPMSDTSGRVVAFSGRLLGVNDKAPKYVNSPETELYKKSELLFGYDKAKHGIRQLDFSLIVEGQFDVVMSHQAGYTNAVAVSGTALTQHHVQLLERLSHRVVLALDADRAGIAAMKRAADLMLRRGLDVKVAEVPDGKDPADLVLEGKDVLKSVVGKSVHVIEFLLHVLRKEYTEDRVFRQKTQSEIYPFVLLLPSRNEQYSFAEIIAKNTSVPVDVIWHEIERLREESKYKLISAERIEDLSLNKPRTSADNHKNAYISLLASIELVPTLDKKQFLELTNNIAKYTEIEEPDATLIAESTFILEQQYEKMPKQAVLEEVIAKINHFKKVVIQDQLKKTRAKLAVEGADQAQILEEITGWEKVLREDPLTIEEFVSKKD